MKSGKSASVYIRKLEDNYVIASQPELPLRYITLAPTTKVVGRKIFREETTKKRPKNSKKTPKNNSFKPLSTIFVPCMKIHCPPLPTPMPAAVMTNLCSKFFYGRLTFNKSMLQLYTCYRNLSEDETFVYELKVALRHCLAVLYRRVNKVFFVSFYLICYCYKGTTLIWCLLFEEMTRMISRVLCHDTEVL